MWRKLSWDNLSAESSFKVYNWPIFSWTASTTSYAIGNGVIFSTRYAASVHKKLWDLNLFKTLVILVQVSFLLLHSEERKSVKAVSSAAKFCSFA